MKGELNRTVMIYVDSYVNNVPSGRFHIASEQEVQSFYGLSQLLLGINRKLDQENFPQAFFELRKFQTPSKQEKTFAFTQQKSGKISTFSLKILFRQNASWQGTLTWIEGGQEVYFRSVLELIVLLDDALGYTTRE